MVMELKRPSYLELEKTGELEERSERLYELLSPCELCPRKCGVDRLNGELGFCGAGAELLVSSAHPHFGEEAPLVGDFGSGTIFLAGCNLRCIFCQNYDISHQVFGQVTSIKELAVDMLRLQRIGCHNINFVTPTHVTPQLVEGIREAIHGGLKIPIVYNCGGYEKVETLKLLTGIIDIYMPDMKYGRSVEAEKFSNAKNYPEICFRAVAEMHNQVGDLLLDENSIAYRGLLVRHLIMPGDIAGSDEVFKFISEKISKDTYINIMDQYRPEYNAWKFKELSRKPTNDEYLQAVELAKKYGLEHGETYRHRSVLERLRDIL